MQRRSLGCPLQVVVGPPPLYKLTGGLPVTFGSKSLFTDGSAMYDKDMKCWVSAGFGFVAVKGGDGMMGEARYMSIKAQWTSATLVVPFGSERIMSAS